VSALRERLQKVASVEGTFKSAKHSHFVARFEGYGEERLAWGPVVGAACATAHAIVERMPAR